MKATAFTLLSLFISMHGHSQGIKDQSTLTLTREKKEQAIPQNYYAQHMGFFCKQELKMQKAHVPVTFRLGSMNYCNWLEQKPGYW